jgi:hypothetical protein
VFITSESYSPQDKGAVCVLRDEMKNRYYIWVTPVNDDWEYAIVDNDTNKIIEVFGSKLSSIKEAGEDACSLCNDLNNGNITNYEDYRKNYDH